METLTYVYNPIMLQKWSWLKYAALMAALFLLTGCGGESSPEPTATLVSARPSITAPPAPPTPTLLSGATATVPADDCFNDAVFVEDVTIPDFSLVKPGEVLDKRWVVQNSGTCDWGAGYKLVRLGADDFSGPTELALFPAAAGSSAELSVELTAPEEPGEYISRWQAYSDEGIPFGQEIYMLIEIPTPTPAPTATESTT